jgi:hypothetical protein
MRQFNNEEKAQIYNQLLFQYQRLQEQVRQIKANNFNLNEQEQRKVDELEGQMKRIYMDTQRLYN